MNKGMRMLLMTGTDKEKKREKEEESRRKIEENRQRDMEIQRNLERYRDDTYNEKYGLENRYRGDGMRTRRIPYENPVRVGSGYMTYDDGVQMRYGGEPGRVDPDGDGYVGYGDIESRFRDRRGREHYDNGRYAPKSYWNEGDDGEDDTWVDSRRGGARKRDSRGRFTSFYNDGGYGRNNTKRVEHPDRPDRIVRNSYFPPNPDWPPMVPPIYKSQNQSQPYPNRPIPMEERPMNKIGFSIDGQMEHLPDEMGGVDYQTDATHRGWDNEMMYSQSGRSSGYANGSPVPKFDREMAMEWTENMQNEDGTTGPHWSMEQVKQLMAQKGLEYSPEVVYACLNMMYSDYCKVAKKLNVNNMDFYICMTKAFLDDKDFNGTPEEKLALYFTEIVEH